MAGDAAQLAAKGVPQAQGQLKKVLRLRDISCSIVGAPGLSKSISHRWTVCAVRHWG